MARPSAAIPCCAFTVHRQIRSRSTRSITPRVTKLTDALVYCLNPAGRVSAQRTMATPLLSEDQLTQISTQGLSMPNILFLALTFPPQPPKTSSKRTTIPWTTNAIPSPSTICLSPRFQPAHLFRASLTMARSSKVPQFSRRGTKIYLGPGQSVNL